MQDRIKSLIENDMIFRLFQMELLDSGEGYGRVRAEVKKEFLNAHQIAHGGLIFALLDVAFAIAVNSLTDSVGIQWSFNVLRSASLGARISAEARTIHKGRSLMVVEFKVENETNNALMAQGMATALPLPKR